jgi:purine-binding chemotaxis protein CheW
MSEADAGGKKALILGVQTCVCAVPLRHVIETMRPLPIEGISGVPSFVRGVAVIRGIPTPVVDLGAILGTSPEFTGDRLVTVRSGDRQVALSVSTVLGIRDLDVLTTTQELPPLLQGAPRDVIEKIGMLDERFLMVLQEGWELADEVWHAMRTQEVVS